MPTIENRLDYETPQYVLRNIAILFIDKKTRAVLSSVRSTIYEFLMDEVVFRSMRGTQPLLEIIASARE